MSHFSVIVCLRDRNGLDAALAPFDENKEVEPYRVYEDGGPNEFWLYKSLRRAAEDHENGTGILPYKPDELGWSSASSKDTPEVQAKQIADDAAVFRALPDPVTWADIAHLHNDRYGDDDPLLYDDATGRAYRMSTRNPDSKWDYWRVGGRWGGYFRYRAGDRKWVITPQRGWDSPEVIAANACDGGPRFALDLDALREDKVREARETYAKWSEIVEGTPEALPWRVFADNVSAIEGYSIEDARREYHSQPRVQAISGTDFRFYDDPINTFQQTEDAFVEKERLRAVPGYAVLTLDGKWMAPGRMGWFGMSTDEEGDRIGYWEAANAYIDSLPDSTWLIAVDCHI